ncbi:gephyrin-like molybdotransferase receptor GlpR [Streptomyces sp. NPDC090306]|uniref:divisome protein SepX/GlpR n=1 Tax=Streptomyces sp. NPDC090306 TaxID=3365961 RepID=UPI0038050404
MSSSGLIYAVIVGAWAAYLVPMWLRRQDELNEARPTERFSTAIRLLSGRAGMERRYAKDLQARSFEEGEGDAGEPDAVTDSVDVRSFAAPPTAAGTPAPPEHPRSDASRAHPREDHSRRQEPRRRQDAHPAAQDARPQARAQVRAERPSGAREHAAREQGTHEGAGREAAEREPAPRSPSAPADRERPGGARRAAEAEAAAARARRTKVLARRRRTTVVLFLVFTLGAIVAAVGGLAFLWAPAAPAVLLSGYIAHLRSQERRRFTYQMDRRRAEDAARRLRERQPRRRASEDTAAHDVPDAEPEGDAGLSALAADRRALVEQTDHAEWVDQQRERQRRPEQGDSWDPVPVPLPTYVTAPVAPRATSDVDLGAPDAWSSARSSAVAPERDADAEPAAARADAAGAGDDEYDGAADRAPEDGRSDARRAASARRSRERGRTPLFDQYDEEGRPRAANE